VCVKVPPASRSTAGRAVQHSLGYYRQEWYSETRAFAWSGMIEEDLPADVCGRLIAAQAAILKRVGPHWNHEPIGLGNATIDGSACPVLLMNAYQGQTLNSFAPERRREIFPTLLPALWDALSHCPHGDLKDDSIFLDSGERFFRILDPGSLVRDDRPGPTRSNNFELRFATNLAHYPVLCPEFGPGPPRAFSGTLYDLLLHRGGGPFFMDLPFDCVAERTDSSARPSASDLLALGLIYLSYLAPNALEPLKAVFGPHPMWSFMGFDAPAGWPKMRLRLLSALQGGLLEDLLPSSQARPGQRELCIRLLTLRIDCQETLMTLVQQAA